MTETFVHAHCSGLAADTSLCIARRRALEDHVGAAMRSEPGRYFSIGLPFGSLRSLKAVLAVSELAADAFDSGEVGVSGARPEIYSASSLAGSEHLCDRGKQLVFFTVVDGHIGRAVRIKVGGQQKLSDVQVVTVHSLLNFRPADQVCVASLSPMITTSCGMGDAALTLHPATLSSECLLSMYCWEQSPDNVLYVPLQPL